MKHLLLSIVISLTFCINCSAQSLEESKKLHELGRKSMIEGNIKLGREYTKQALDMRKILLGEVSEDYITSLNNYAYTFALEKDFSKAIEYQEQVMALCEKLPKPHKNYGMYAFNMGRFYMATDNYDGASIYLEKALPLVEKYSEPYENILQWLGIIYIERKDVKNQERILYLTEEHNIHELSKECNEPKCMLERAEYYAAKGASADAKKCYLNVLGMSLDNQQKAKVYKSYASFLAKNKDYKSAAEYEMSLASLTSQLEGKNKAYAIQRYMAGLYSHLGEEYLQAIENFDSAIDCYHILNDKETLKKIADCNKAKGNAYSALKDRPKAIEAYKAYVSYYEQNDINSNDYPKALLRLAVAEKFNKEYESSISHHKQAMNLFEKKGMSQEYTEAASSLKLCYVYMGKNAATNGLATQVDFKEKESMNERKQKLRKIIEEETANLDLTKKYLGKLAYAHSMATIAGSYSMIENYDSAVVYYKLYIKNIREAIMEEFRMQGETERMQTWKEELSIIRNIQELLVTLPNDFLALKGELATIAYDAELLSKGILLNSTIEFEKLLAQKNDKKLKILYQDIKNLRNTILHLRRNAKNNADFAKIFELEQGKGRLELQLYKACSEFADYTNYISYDWKDVQKQLKPTDIAIEFVAIRQNAFDTYNNMIALVLSSDMKNPVFIPVCTIAAAREMAKDSSLYDKKQNIIWGQLKQYIDDKHRLFFSADGIFSQVAIEYLSYNGKPLSEQKQVYRLSSTKELCYNHNEQKASRAILIGDIDYNGLDSFSRNAKRSLSAIRSNNPDDLIFSDLTNTTKEIEGIKSALEKGKIKKVSTLKNSDASKKAFLSLSDTKVNILHLATHGAYLGSDKISEEESMKKSVLALSGANVDSCGIISASEIAHMNLRECDLAVLSACESGMGKLGNDGVFGLQRGFKNAGVHTILMSLRKVYDDATATLMLEFYNGLMNGKNKLEALIEAQKTLKAKGHKDAKYWTPFILLDAF